MKLRLHDGFMDWSCRSPEAVALSIEGQDISYRQLAGHAAAVAHRLRESGVGRNDRVAILADKGIGLYASILGALMAGAAYVPLAPGYPAARLKIILEGAEPLVVLHEHPALWREIDVGAAVAQLEIEKLLAEPPPQSGSQELTASINTPNDLAYILFTSGSTGRPKGVMVSHGNAVAFTQWARDFFQVKPGDRLSGHSDLTFDLSVFDTFVALSSGATLVPVTKPFDRTAPGRFIRDRNVTIWFSVPSVLSGMEMLGEIKPDYLDGLRWMVFCGEALPPNPTRTLMSAVKGLRVANLYGPTEATVACSAFQLPGPPPSDADAVPIGWRTGGTEVFVWHDAGRVAENGETGEIHISGDQVALGYFRNPEETSTCFVDDPRFPDVKAPCYRTGDVGEVRPDGPVFKGRRDLQIKFRGWRIETGDVERELAALDGVTEGAVAVVKRDGRPDVFVAFVRQSITRSPTDVLNLLKHRLADYMTPTHVRVVEDFPRTLNGKIDRKRLGELF